MGFEGFSHRIRWNQRNLGDLENHHQFGGVWPFNADDPRCDEIWRFGGWLFHLIGIAPLSLDTPEFLTPAMVILHLIGMMESSTLRLLNIAVDNYPFQICLMGKSTINHHV